jgi:diphthamide synthase (EF-2-diphthine--ammonia ligase)
MSVDNRKKAVFNWSGGKDSALALNTVLQQNEFEVVALLTTVNEETELSSMHAIPHALLEKQAESIGIPLYLVFLPKNLPVYE